MCRMKIIPQLRIKDAPRGIVPSLVLLCVRMRMAKGAYYHNAASSWKKIDNLIQMSLFSFTQDGGEVCPPRWGVYVFSSK